MYVLLEERVYRYKIDDSNGELLCTLFLSELRVWYAAKVNPLLCKTYAFVSIISHFTHFRDRLTVLNKICKI